jgi:hypothetical protein
MPYYKGSAAALPRCSSAVYPTVVRCISAVGQMVLAFMTNLYRLAPTLSLRLYRLCIGLEKGHSTLATQPRNGKVGFNVFLHERRVDSVTSTQCRCGIGAIVVG